MTTDHVNCPGLPTLWLSGVLCGKPFWNYVLFKKPTCEICREGIRLSINAHPAQKIGQFTYF